MSTSFLHTREDLKWLEDVHGIKTENFQAAIIYGNEDWPEKIECFLVNSCECTPNTYRLDAFGKAFLVKA